MRWCRFLFCCSYRLTLALLAHFNWFASIYFNCIYFVLWKSYDLLWFWMHLILCICFKPLRTKNCLIIWCNLICKRITLYPNNTYKEIYMLEYRKLQKTKRKQKRGINEAETYDGKREEEDSSNDNDSSDGEDVDAAGIKRTESEELNFPSLADNEECECRKRIFMNETVISSANRLRQCDHNEAPIPPPRLKRTAKSLEEGNCVREAGSHKSTRGRCNRFDIRNMILKPFKNCKQCGYCALCGTERYSLRDAVEMKNNGLNIISDARNQIGLADRVRRYLPVGIRREKGNGETHEEENGEAYSHKSTHGRCNRFDIRNVILKPLKNCKKCGTERHSLHDAVELKNNGLSNISDAGSQIRLTERVRRYLPVGIRAERRDSSVRENDIDILTPDFTNKRDLTSAKEIFLRQRRDQRVLKKRLRAQKRAELAIIAKYEAKQKAISSSIELLLQILQMMASFAILIGNIRKTFIPAHFNWLKHGRDDSMELMILWRCTVFLDVLLFWINVIWVYCLQCHLCCRLGPFKFWIWILTLGLIGGIFVLYPMSYVQRNLDISWCQFKPNTILAQYQPNW
ncbi:unnamed protein product [Cercopithifilaria johnstoni]|uniref:Uncharacterized protein n=1 Tax=Cercopithifilaria johnstoni TaxID=2874296 RepID=A0A8J2QAF6_9BILA|nr:unnamed protein product [Cercopithifilaria johnstoni]